MGILERFLLGQKSATEMEADEQQNSPNNPIPLLSSAANSLVFRCSKILFLTMEKLQQCFEAEFPDHVEQPSLYARGLVEYCSYKALNMMTKQPDSLADKEFRQLTYDMMLAWEIPDTESELILKAAVSKHSEVEDEDGGALFYASPTSMAIQVDDKKTVGLDAFSRIAPACPAVADPITVHNLFDVLTCSSGGQLHFFMYDKYLKSLDKGWIRYILPCIFFSLAVLMLGHKHLIRGKPIEAFQITPPPTKNAIEQLLTLQETITQLETFIQTGNIVLLKLRAILFAAFPQTTDKVAIALTGTAVIFAFVPFKHMVVLGLLDVYTREMPLRKQSSEKLIRRMREWWVRIPAAPVQLIRPQEHKKSN